MSFKEPLHLILASASPRRADLLHSLNIPFEAIPSHFDEESIPFTGDMEAYVCELARSKALTIAARYPKALVLGADSAAFLEGRVLNKPRDAGEAEEFLKMLSGKWHKLYTGVCLVHGGRSHTQAEASEVLFNELGTRHIAAYIASGEWRGKAGGYTIQRWGALLIARVVGCYYNVTGLPFNTLEQLMRTLGLSLWDYLE